MNYYDAHTHLKQIKSDDFSIYNLDYQNLPDNMPKYFCLGIHPWTTKDASISKLEEAIKMTQTTMLGEIGIDKIKSDISLTEQIELFENLLTLSKDLHLNHLVIHSVKSHQEIFQSLKKLKITAKILFHDFNNNQETALQFLDHFECYFSFGHSLFKENSKAYACAQSIHLNKILLETDDQAKFQIDDIYNQFQKVRNLETDQISQLIKSNFEKFIS